MPAMLDEIQDEIYQRALNFRDEHTRSVDDWPHFVAGVASGWVSVLHCGRPVCEDDIKAETAATPRCIPIDGPNETGTCVRCGQPSDYGKRLLFARAY
jgi:prolyl-tRNA synthetase